METLRMTPLSLLLLRLWFRTCLSSVLCSCHFCWTSNGLNRTFRLDYPYGDPEDDTELHQLGVGAWTTTWYEKPSHWAMDTFHGTEPGHQKFKSEKRPGISFLIRQLHVAIPYCTNFLYILFLMYQAWRSGNGCKRKTGRNLLTNLFGNKDLILYLF
jgi:hypothetical protein